MAREGLPAQGRLAGHCRLASLPTMVGRGVNLVVAHPWVRKHSGPERWAYRPMELLGLRRLPDLAARNLPKDASVLEMALDDEVSLVVLYLTPNAAVDAAIARHGWRRYPLLR